MPAAASTFARLQTAPLSRLFRALGDDTRVRMVALLAHGELCVCHVQGALGLPQPTVSRQLTILKTAGIVDSRRAGTWVYYRLADQLDKPCRKQLKALVAGFAKEDVLRRDVARLVKTRGPGACR